MQKCCSPGINKENTVESQISVTQIKDKSQIKDILCAGQNFTALNYSF